MADSPLEKIKRLVIISMFSDDDLMEVLVLKGGNALDLIYGISPRASVDFDFSIENEFPKTNLEIVRSKIARALKANFSDSGLVVFDVTMKERPPIVSEDMADFWGGYLVEFKLIEDEKFRKFEDNLKQLRRNALRVGGGKAKLKIDISKYEYCKRKKEGELDGIKIYVYTPEMLVLEKLRAICQQTEEYAEIVRSSSRSARARDFFDIEVTIRHFQIDITEDANIDLLKALFDAKRVPLALLGKIEEYREYHRSGYVALKVTLKPGTEIQDYDYYFDYVLSLVKKLEPLWNK